MEPIHIRVDNTQSRAKETVEANHYPYYDYFQIIPVDYETYHAVIDFGDDHAPIYISASKIPSKEDEQWQIEESQKYERNWEIAHPVESVLRNMDDAISNIEFWDNSYKESEKRFLTAEKIFKLIPPFDYQKEKQSIAILISEIEKYKKAGFRHSLRTRSEMHRLEYLLKDKKAKIAHYEAAKQELEESREQRALDLSSDMRIWAQGYKDGLEYDLKEARKKEQAIYSIDFAKLRLEFANKEYNQAAKRLEFFQTQIDQYDIRALKQSLVILEEAVSCLSCPSFVRVQIHKIYKEEIDGARDQIAQYESLQKEFEIVLEARNKAADKKKEAEAKVKESKENKRYTPGIATGKGKKVGEKWLADAVKGNGSPIPEQIADKLRNKEFKNFDDFRREFWEEISKEPELVKQFNKQNQVIIQKGKSPFTQKKDKVGKRERFELHHIESISENGEVYDMDNLGVTTPKRHIDIHRGE